METIMDRKTALKLIASTFGLIACWFAILLVIVWWTRTEWGALLGFFLATLIVGALMGHFYPIWFKDYIEAFWRRQEEKENEKKELEGLKPEV